MGMREPACDNGQSPGSFNSEPHACTVILLRLWPTANVHVASPPTDTLKLQHQKVSQNLRMLHNLLAMLGDLVNTRKGWKFSDSCPSVPVCQGKMDANLVRPMQSSFGFCTSCSRELSQQGSGLPAQQWWENLRAGPPRKQRHQFIAKGLTSQFPGRPKLMSKYPLQPDCLTWPQSLLTSHTGLQIEAWSFAKVFTDWQDLGFGEGFAQTLLLFIHQICWDPSTSAESLGCPKRWTHMPTLNGHMDTIILPSYPGEPASKPIIVHAESTSRHDP